LRHPKKTLNTEELKQAELDYYPTLSLAFALIGILKERNPNETLTLKSM
jgi:hypothetical protein